jgi:predicted secreted protein
MTTQARIGYGRLLSVQDVTSPDVFITLGEITAINGPNFAADAVDVTHMQSTDGFREFIPGLRDAGEFSGDVNYNPTDSGMIAFLETIGTKRTFKIVERSATSPAPSVTCDGIVTAFKVTGAVADKMQAAFTIKLSGSPVMDGVTFPAQL